VDPRRKLNVSLLLKWAKIRPIIIPDSCFKFSARGPVTERIEEITSQGLIVNWSDSGPIILVFKVSLDDPPCTTGYTTLGTFQYSHELQTGKAQAWVKLQGYSKREFNHGTTRFDTGTIIWSYYKRQLVFYFKNVFEFIF